MTLINLAPDARGVENIARSFREGIQRAQEKLAKVERLIEDVEAGDGEYRGHLSSELDLIAEGLWLVVAQENDRVIELDKALYECELCVEANRVLRQLREEEVFNEDDFKGIASTLRDAIALIGKLAERAGMKG